MSVQVSAVIIALDEEADIARAVDSASWCDEVLVVDSGSTDRTVEICAARGCKVIHREFTGYGEQKAFAVMQAANDWVFVVDADEEVTPALRDEIRQKLDSPGDCRGFRVPITTILWDKVIRTKDRHTAAKLRLFDRRYGNFQRQLVHESVALEGRTELLRERMYNHSYENIADYFDKFNRYTTAGALQCLADGKSHGVVAAVVRLPLTFFQVYLGKGHVWDGPIGLMWSLFSAFYPAVKYLKLWELRKAASRQSTEEQAAPVEPIQMRRPQPAVLVEQPAGGQALIRRPFLARAARRVRRMPLFILASAACAVGLALVWMPLFGQDPPGDYAASLLFAVLVTTRLWGYRAALVATALSIVALDYFTIAPPDAFALPQTQDIYRLGIFLALSLLTISVVYGARHRPIR
jgi:glycosyltransferase involved in cell wall biosynthesis